MVILIQIHCLGKCDKTEYTCRIVVFITDVSSQNTNNQNLNNLKSLGDNMQTKNTKFHLGKTVFTHRDIY